MEVLIPLTILPRKLINSTVWTVAIDREGPSLSTAWPYSYEDSLYLKLNLGSRLKRKFCIHCHYKNSTVKEIAMKLCENTYSVTHPGGQETANDNRIYVEHI